MSSRSRMVNASPVSSAPSLDVASANLRVPCGPSSVRRQAAIDPSASALPAGLAGSIDALIQPSGLHAGTAAALALVPRCVGSSAQMASWGERRVDAQSVLINL